jgi:hypothetical protein
MPPNLARQVSGYDFSDPGWNANAGRFTQLVWRDSVRMGCAYNGACTWPVYVCHYRQPGNVIGADWAQQVQALANRSRA